MDQAGADVSQKRAGSFHRRERFLRLDQIKKGQKMITILAWIAGLSVAEIVVAAIWAANKMR
jgi:hypothetical protein